MRLTGFRSVLFLFVFVSTFFQEDCRAQNELFARIKAVREVPVWQRTRRRNTEIRRLLQQLHSKNKDEMRDAMEQIALTYPIPTAADQVVKQVQAVAKKTRDKFANAMSFRIKGDWTEAKKAAETLLQARRNGGLRYLEQLLVRGKGVQSKNPLIALAYSGNAQSARLVAQHWTKNTIHGKKAILIIGPLVAPDLARQLNTDDRRMKSEVTDLLAKIGTQKQIPILKSAASNADRLLERKMNEAIREISARIEKEKSSKSKSKKKTKSKKKSKKS